MFTGGPSCHFLRSRTDTVLQTEKAVLNTFATSPLRMVLFVDDIVLPRWVEWMLADAVEAGLMSIAAVVVNEQAEAAPMSGGRLTRLARNWRDLPYAAFLRYDRPALGDEVDPFEMTSIEHLLHEAVIIRTAPRRTTFSDYLSDEVVTKLQELKLDVGLRLGFRIMRGGALRVARHGIWSFHHGDNRDFRGGPAGFWEVVERAPITGAILQELSEDLDGGLVLFRTCVPTDPVSPQRNRARLYWAAARGLRGALKRVQLGLAAPDCEDRVVPYGGRMYNTPDGWLAVRACAGLVARRIANRVARAAAPEWRIGWRFDRQHVPGDVPDLSPHRLKVRAAANGSLEADPFVVAVDGGYEIFYEELPPGTTRGRIARTHLDGSGKPGSAAVVLERPHHLSYPMVFAWDGDWYMVPESYEAGCQEVFRAEPFPDSWTLHARWFEGEPLVDSTIFQFGDRWWLFGSRPVPQTLVGDELHLYHAPTPLGPWTAHLQNPVRSGVDGSRPAGIPFEWNGTLVRPAQVGAPHYGAAVRFWKVETLTTDRYVERDLGTLKPAWAGDVAGYHTINSAGHVTVGDLLIRKPGARSP